MSRYVVIFVKLNFYVLATASKQNFNFIPIFFILYEIFFNPLFHNYKNNIPLTNTMRNSRVVVHYVAICKKYRYIQIIHKTISKKY